MAKAASTQKRAEQSASPGRQPKLTAPAGSFVLGQSADGGVFTWHRVKNGIVSALGEDGAGLHLTQCGEQHPGEAVNTQHADYKNCTRCG